MNKNVEDDFFLLQIDMTLFDTTHKRHDMTWNAKQWWIWHVIESVYTGKAVYAQLPYLIIFTLIDKTIIPDSIHPNTQDCHTS